MLRACLLIFSLTLSLALCAQQGIGPVLSFNNARDSADQLKDWIAGLMAMPDKDSLSAYARLNAALEKIRPRQNRYHQALLESAYGALLRRHKQYHRSFGRYLHAHELLVEANRPYELVTAALELAKAQYFRGNYRHAMQHYSYAMQEARKYGFTDKEQEGLEILGLLYNAFQNFTRGAEIFRQSLEVKYRLHDEPGIMHTLEILSDIYYRQHKYDSSLMYAGMALQSAIRLQKPTDIELSRLNKAAALIRLKRFREARAELDSLSKLDIRGTNVNLAVRYNVLTGNYLLALRRDAQALLHYDTALQYAQSQYFQELQALTYSHIADSYAERGEFHTAYEYARKYHEMAATYYTGENVIRLGNLETILQIDLSEDEIRYLNNENKLKQLQLLREAELRANLEKENILKDSILRQEQLLREVLSRENAYKKRELEAEKKLRSLLSKDNSRQQHLLRNERQMRLLLLVAFAALLALGAVIYYLYRKQRRKNDIIQKQADDMQTLMKEIHHRVKNNLQIISSLLDLQALSIRHDEAAQAVKEGRNRVHSMALIHQNLYSEGNIKGIRVKNYIDTLAQGLFHSYNIKAGNVQLKTDIDDLNLDVDTVIPIGLILNELITNSLKYAFHEKQQGEISVLLKKEPDSLWLKVRDNGHGFAPNAGTRPETTFGLKLIRAFAQKLKAKLSIYNDNGACVEMHIARYKLA